MVRCSNCQLKIKSKELLGKGEKLCKGCLRKLPRCTCVYCKVSFHLLDRNRRAATAAGAPAEASTTATVGSSSADSTRLACADCTKRKEEFGEPQGCEYCELRSAFVGTKCHHCTKSEMRFGQSRSRRKGGGTGIRLPTPIDSTDKRHPKPVCTAERPFPLP